MTKEIALTPQGKLIRGRIDGIRAQLGQLASRPPESRAQFKAERKRLYAALDDLLMQIWSCVPYENLISPICVEGLLRTTTKRLKLEG